MQTRTPSILAVTLTLAAARALSGCAELPDTADVAAQAVTAPLRDASWGASNEGGGFALADLDGDANPEVIFARMDAPSGGNYGYFRIGWDVGRASADPDDYQAASFGPSTQIPGSMGDHTSGAGIAVGDINRNGRPDLVFLYVDNPNGQDATRYRIGWDVSTTGQVSAWSSPKVFTGGFHGHHTAGADVALADLDGNGQLEMAVATVDNPSGDNTISYAIGWNLSTSGDVSTYGATYAKPGWVGHETADLGLAFADMNRNGVPDLVISWADAPGGADVLSVQTVYEPGRNRTYPRWSPLRRLGDVQEDVQAAGIVGYDFAGDGATDLWAMTLGPIANVNTASLRMHRDRADRNVRLRNNQGGCARSIYTPGANQRTPIISHEACDGGALAQVFTLAQTDSGKLAIIESSPDDGGACLSIGPQSGATASVASCSGGVAQQWELIDGDNDGLFQIRSVNSGLCLSPRPVTTFAESFEQSPCSASQAAQEFSLAL